MSAAANSDADTANTPAAAIVVESVARRFGRLEAVRGVSVTIARGEIFGLVGPDGAGKTTLMRMLAGVLRPDAGRIVLEGIDVAADPERAKTSLSYMPQRFGLYEDLTVAENVFFYGELFEVPRDRYRTRSAELLDAAGLAPFRRRLAGQLSGGMKQKLGLVCALIHTPKVLLLDEPTTGVDPVSRRDFWAILYRLREEGVTIVMSTAYMDEAERCSRLALLYGGAVRECDTPARLKARMPGALLAVQADRPRDAYAALDGLPGVLGLLLMGDRVHVRVDDAARRTPEVAARLNERGVAGVSIATVEPGIEDVFVALIGEAA
ncbi:ABC transporter ATP-binding protein [Paraburkholderia caballeronis]|uniref:ABC-2 type transport system ATP-binding protein n=1 Tax=Paraburkholderia caballeronis TaxID=416943 RepID=A0A1H7P8H8_9BURK|nr:ABC transporter ATP-binding protein [Paraburkholderia caballeronis]PXW25348.1 ABC-2 type transport system ATP-binding protein [Paraburkholderia caballeronis]PXX00955.1 ABC-2 type transport system ATP-binding protein [Paraburkholderia caballeronis]RAJ99692.1 ABC-2 type transport system ATP-binding protein [Paraburkholderia caballeronis]SEE40960.1 ABC-2 type transport system ATP-binding protein [Paraburkholderia caballeronis]SEL31708.1 ABC-2 type transport system ATP-binding protein [Paraburk